MSLVLDGKSLRVNDVVRVARSIDNKIEQIDISDDAWNRIKKCRAFVENEIEKGTTMYGVNTGIGELAEVRLPDDDIVEFQANLMRSHAAGVGEPFAIPVVRAAMISRINVHCNGNSGLRPIIVQTLVDMLNKGVTPIVPMSGSVGACGDLAPMAHIGLVVMGESEAWYNGEIMPGSVAMSRAGIEVQVFQARDGLAFINGSNVICGFGCLELEDIFKWIKIHEITASLTFETLNVNPLFLDPKIHIARGFPGQIESSDNIRKITEDSEILYTEALGKKKVQDSYSLRCTPQIVGTARDAYRYTHEQYTIELNGSVDNPLFFPDEEQYIAGGNFQGTPLAIPMEMLATSIVALSVLSERRMNRMMNSHLSQGLPPFLTKEAGKMSGLMIPQYTQGALVAESKILATPAAIQSIPAAADQEDFVSMGMTTAFKTNRIIDNAYYIIAIELIAAAQAYEFRKPHKIGKGSKAAYDWVRNIIPSLDIDRQINYDIEKIKAALVEDNSLVESVESVIGELA